MLELETPPTNIERPAEGSEDIAERIEEQRGAAIRAIGEDRLDEAETAIASLRELKLKEAAIQFSLVYPSEGSPDRVERQFQTIIAELKKQGEPTDAESVRQALLSRMNIANKGKRMIQASN